MGINKLKHKDNYIIECDLTDITTLIVYNLDKSKTVDLSEYIVGSNYIQDLNLSEVFKEDVVFFLIDGVEYYVANLTSYFIKLKSMLDRIELDKCGEIQFTKDDCNTCTDCIKEGDIYKYHILLEDIKRNYNFENISRMKEYLKNLEEIAGDCSKEYTFEDTDLIEIEDSNYYYE